MADFKTGDKLPNGAILVEIVKRSGGTWIVLARFTEPQPWVTWMMDEHGHCYWGHYHTHLKDAVEDFSRRSANSWHRV